MVRGWYFIKISACSRCRCEKTIPPNLFSGSFIAFMWFKSLVAIINESAFEALKCALIRILITHHFKFIPCQISISWISLELVRVSWRYNLWWIKNKNEITLFLHLCIVAMPSSTDFFSLIVTSIESIRLTLGRTRKRIF